MMVTASSPKRFENIVFLLILLFDVRKRFHEEWCCEHLHFVKKEEEEEGRKGGPGELEGV